MRKNIKKNCWSNLYNSRNKNGDCEKDAIEEIWRQECVHHAIKKIADK